MPDPDFTIKRNDRLPTIIAILSDADGVIDLTNVGSDQVRFVMRGENTAAATVNAVASIDDADAGRVSYAWQEDDTATAGTYQAEWQVTFPTGERATFPNDHALRIVIVPDLP
jgi:hypothetical protein